MLDLSSWTMMMMVMTTIRLAPLLHKNAADTVSVLSSRHLPRFLNLVRACTSGFGYILTHYDGQPEKRRVRLFASNLACLITITKMRPTIFSTRTAQDQCFSLTQTWHAYIMVRMRNVHGLKRHRWRKNARCWLLRDVQHSRHKKLGIELIRRNWPSFIGLNPRSIQAPSNQAPKQAATIVSTWFVSLQCQSSHILTYLHFLATG